MQKNKLIPFIVMVSTSSVAVASGMHSGGHENHTSKMPMQHWMAPMAEATRLNPVKATALSVKQGEKLYQQNCLSCHGVEADGNGLAGKMLNPKPANLRVMSGTHPDGDFAYKIKQGRGAMPAWKDALNDKQVWHLVNFIQSLNENPVVTQQQDHGHEDEQHSHGS